MQKWKLVKAVALGLTLTACSDGNDSKAKVNQAVEGIYSGFFTSDRLQRTFAVAGVVLETGEGHFVNRDTGEQLVIALSVDGEQIAGPLRVYQPTDPTADAAMRNHGGLDGSATSRDAIAGSYNVDDGDSGTFSLLYDRALYERSSRMPQLTGIWAAESVDERYSISLGMYENGLLYGSDSNSCVYAGTVTLPDTRFNLFRVNEVSVTCSTTAYSGQGWIVHRPAQAGAPDTADQFESIELGFIGETRAYYNRLTKRSGTPAR